MPASPTALKVLHVISGDLWAGAETQAFTLLSMLHRNGLDVQAVLMNDGELARRLAGAGVAVTIFDERRLGSLSILASLRRLMRSWQPDIVHTHRTKENVLGSLANRFSRNVPSVRTAHGANEHARRGLRQLPRRLFLQLDRWCGNFLQQRVIAVSNDLARRLRDEFPGNRIVVIENGVDPEALRAQVHPVEFRSSAPQATHVGIVGRLVPVKRVDLFLAMAAMLRSAHPDRHWRFHVFGDGPLRDSLQKQARQLAVQDITTFHGHRSDVIACMAAIDMLVMCSDHEGMPMSALEALAVGTQVVAHAVGGLVEVVELHPSSVLVHAHDAAGYADAVHQVTARGAAANAAVPLDQRFHADQNARRVDALYRSLAS